jgi:hypothetical protein
MMVSTTDPHPSRPGVPGRDQRTDRDQAAASTRSNPGWNSIRRAEIEVSTAITVAGNNPVCDGRYSFRRPQDG